MDVIILMRSLGHYRLTQLGFLHCDISAGNIMLAIDPEKQGHAGFLVDVELLKKYPKETEYRGVVEVCLCYQPCG